MASYHCTVKTGGKGRAGPHSDYIEREGKYSPELVQGKSKLEDLEHKASGNMPKWAEHSAGVFWRAADEYERANGATYREIEIALPRELNPEQRRALVEDFIQQQLGDRHAYTYAIHIPKAAIENGDQPHCHLMYSERTLDGIDRDPEQYFKRANTKSPEKGGCKKDSAGTKERLLATRELWAEVQNQHLEKAGCEDRVSHLSLKARGIDRTPEKHFGPADAKKIDAPALLESRSAERELELARTELSKIDVTAALAAELAAQAQREAAEQQAQQAQQAQRAAAAIAQAAAQAQREAALVLVQAAAAQAAIAQAQHEAAKQAALNTELTAAAEAKEKEDDGIRAAALAKIDGNVRAARASWEGTVSAVGASAGSLNASRRVADSNGKIADRVGRNTEGAAKGAKRREFGKHLEGCSKAVGEQLGNVNHILQQLVECVEHVVRSVTAAAQAVVRRDIERNLDRIHKAQEAEFQKALQAEQKAAQAAAKTIPAVQVLDTSAFDKTGLWRSDDLDLVQRAKDLYSQAEPAGYDRHMLGREISKAMGEAVSRIRATEPKANHFGVENTIKMEQNTAARSAGQPEPWKAEQTACAWDVLAFRLDRERQEHLETKRPSGMFSGAAGKEYDAKTAGFTSQIDNITRATATLKAELQARVAEQAQQAAQNAPQHAAAQERHAGLTLLHKAVSDATRQIEANEPQPEPGNEPGNDFGR